MDMFAVQDRIDAAHAKKALVKRKIDDRGLDLKASQQVRLNRLAPGTRAGAGEVMLPWRGDPARAAPELVSLLESLVPREAPVGSAAP